MDAHGNVVPGLYQQVNKYDHLSFLKQYCGYIISFIDAVPAVLATTGVTTITPARVSDPPTTKKNTSSFTGPSCGKSFDFSILNRVISLPPLVPSEFCMNVDYITVSFVSRTKTIKVLKEYQYENGSVDQDTFERPPYSLLVQPHAEGIPTCTNLSTC